MEEIKFYSIPNTEKDIEHFLALFWGFHDFRIYEVHYYPAKDRIDLILEYDNQELKVLLRLEGSVQLHYSWQDFECDWMFGASLRLVGNKRFQWINSDEFDNCPELPDGLFWLMSDKINWTIVDDECKPRAFSFKEFHPSWIEQKKVESGEYEINEEAFQNLAE